MMRNKIFIKTICVILMTALLTFSVGRATCVSAIGTTAAIAGTAFVLTGAVYLSYIALTQGQIILPASDQLSTWLGTVGRKVSQYPSGALAYQDIYQSLARDPLSDVINDVWTWTPELIKSFVNDFVDTRINSDILEYYQNIVNITTTPYDYSYDFQTPILNNPDYILYTGANVMIAYDDSIACIAPSDITTPVRNLLRSDRYIAQTFVDGQWVDVTFIRFGGRDGGRYVYPTYNTSISHYVYVSSPYSNYGSLSLGPAGFLEPFFTDAEIYDEASDTLYPVLPVNESFSQLPSWNDPDNDNRPIIPYVPIPQLPANYTPPTGYVNPQWGFNLQDLLDTLEDLAGSLMDIGAIASLINGFAGLHGDEYYISYNQGDTNFYTYYQPANTYNYDDYYVTNYNIDVSDVDEHLPVDLNTISLYTNNPYIDTVKSSSQNGSTILRDFFVFWHDVDAELVYVLFGCAIVTLIAAFIGKWGHS